MFIADASIITRYSKIYLDRRLKEFNIGLTEHHILIYLSKTNKINQEKIAKNFMIDKGAIAKALTKLEEKELIIRNDNPDNKREKLIRLTKKGESIIDYLSDALVEWNNILFEGLKENEIERISNILEKISENAVNAINGKDDNHE